tara:strand:- start:416 stop:523 length:108 start_codon:yes stop_codon:yes gene_type:complete
MAQYFQVFLAGAVGLGITNLGIHFDTHKDGFFHLF